MGKILGKLERWPEAVRALREAEEADPTFPETHANLLHIYTSYGALDEAKARRRLAAPLPPLFCAPTRQIKAHRTRRLPAAAHGD
eukprot:6285117-Prymnesium_polylepis.1